MGSRDFLAAPDPTGRCPAREEQDDRDQAVAIQAGPRVGAPRPGTPSFEYILAKHVATASRAPLSIANKDETISDHRDLRQPVVDRSALDPESGHRLPGSDEIDGSGQECPKPWGNPVGDGHIDDNLGKLVNSEQPLSQRGVVSIRRIVKHCRTLDNPPLKSSTGGPAAKCSWTAGCACEFDFPRVEPLAILNSKFRGPDS